MGGVTYMGQTMKSVNWLMESSTESFHNYSYLIKSFSFQRLSDYTKVMSSQPMYPTHYEYCVVIVF